MRLMQHWRDNKNELYTVVLIIKNNKEFDDVWGDEVIRHQNHQTMLGED